MTPQSFIFIGRSGSGKGTQAALLIEALKKHDPERPSLYIQSGDELRKFMTTDSFTARLTKKTLENGELMPEFMPVFFWGKIVVERYTGIEHLILDGTPRKLMEAKVLDSLFPFYKFGKPWIVYLDVDHDESTRRLLARARSDDGHAEVQRRLSWFDNEVRPTIEYYRTNPSVNFLDIDGERSIEEIHEDIVKRVGLV